MKKNLIICGGPATGKSLLARYIEECLSGSHQIIRLCGRDLSGRKDMNICVKEIPTRPLLVHIDDIANTKVFFSVMKGIDKNIVIRISGKQHFFPSSQIRFILTIGMAKEDVVPLASSFERLFHLIEVNGCEYTTPQPALPPIFSKGPKN